MCSSANSLARMPATSTSNLRGIADILLAHHVGDARGFGLEMEALDAERREFRQVEAREDVQHHQHGDARAVRRALPDVVALVHGADRRGGLGRVRGKVFQRVQAADAAQRLDHVGGDLAGVERVAAVLGDRAQRLAEFGLMDHVAGHRRLAVRQQIALGVGAVLQLLELVLPVEGDARRDDIALFGGLDRGLQQRVEPELAVVAQDRVPGIDRAGNATPHAPRSAAPNGSCARDTIRPWPPSARGRSRYRRRSCPRPWAGSAQSSRRRCRSIAARSPPSSAQAATAASAAVPPARITSMADERGVRVRRRHHRVLGMDRGAAGEMEIPHREMLSCKRFLSIGRARANAAVTWHIHARLGNGWHARAPMRGICRALRGFPLPGLPDKRSPCRSRSPPSTNSPRCRISGSCASRCARSAPALGLKGSVLLAHEGINGTVAGSDDGIDALVRGVAARRPVRWPARQSRTEIFERCRRCRSSG